MLRPKLPGIIGGCARVLALAVGFVAAQEATPVRETGPHANRVDMVYLPEGFPQAGLVDFDSTVKKAVDYRTTAIMAEPYARYKNFFNYYRVDIAAPAEGIAVCNEPDKPSLFGGRGDCDRLGTVDDGKVWDYIDVNFTKKKGWSPKWVNVILNNPGYYNSGGQFICVFSRNYWGEIALHEGGHAFHNLADEYGGTGFFRCGPNVNVAGSKEEAQTKWGEWMGARQGGYDKDGRSEPVVTTGTYEGGCYTDKGSYRPTPNSKMAYTNQNGPSPYNLPSIEKIISDIYKIVRPVDSIIPAAAGTLSNPESLSVRLVDAHVLWVDWYADNQKIKENGGPVLKLAGSGIPVGAHAIRAHVYDEVVKHAKSDNANRDSLDWVRKDEYLAKMQQDVTWNVTLSSAGVRGIAMERDFKIMGSGKEAISFYSPETLPVHIAALDMRGHRIKDVGERRVNAGLNQLDLSDLRLKQGLYLFQFRVEDRTVYHRVLIQH